MTDAEIRRLDNEDAKNAKRREVFFNTKEGKLALPDMTFEEITEDFERWKEEEKAKRTAAKKAKEGTLEVIGNEPTILQNTQDDEDSEVEVVTSSQSYTATGGRRIIEDPF